MCMYYMNIDTREVASFNRFCSYLIHNFGVGVAQNMKMFTQIENRETQPLADILPTFCFAALIEP